MSIPESGGISGGFSGGMPILKVENLSKHFPIRSSLKLGKRVIRAVDDVSFSIMPGETLGLVGESGSGKTTTGRSIIRIEEPTRGRIIFKDADITRVPNRDMKPIRRNMQMIFQDPYESLNPRCTVGEIISEPMLIHKMYTSSEREGHVQRLLETVGLKPDHIRRYAHEFSGGQRQRISIARALALDPGFIICDEPISALDVSIQAQIINLLIRIQDEMGIAYLFIAHDLAMVRHISHTVAVMYRGRIVEFGPTEEVYGAPAHPYTQALMSAILPPDPVRARAGARMQRRMELDEETASPHAGAQERCLYAGRCSRHEDICANVRPQYTKAGNRHVACHFAMEVG